MRRFGLIACGDDSSFNSTGGSGEVYKEAKASIITLDEQNKTIVAYESRKKDYCVVDELTETASWKTVDRGNDTSTVEYEFISLAENELSFVRDSLKLSVNGNTAVVIKNVSTYTDESGAQYKYASTFGFFVGGSSATIKGTWVSIPCEEKDGELECFGIGDGWEQTTLKISDNWISLTERYIPGEYDDEEDYDYDDYDYYTDDVAQSGLMYSILKVLSGMSDYISSNNSMMENYSEDIEELQSELGIVVSSKSKNAETFVLNGKTYSLKVSKLVADFDRSDDLNLDMTISADGKSCNFYDEYVADISSSTCKADLCPMDIFGRGLPCYHIENRASEDPSITLGDLSYKNFYIFKKYEMFTDPVVKAYMKYFATRNADSRETKTINDKVSLYKADTLIRNKYMTYEFDLHESEEKGKTKAQVETAVTMLADGEPVEKIVKYSRLSEEEVLKLRESSMESATK